MDISIIICSFNRCTSLANTIESICKMAVRSYIEWELIIVDNNSTDNTQDVVASFVSKGNKNIRYIFEKKQGGSYAKNRGISEAKGQIIAFTDDDVIVDNNWLMAIYLILNKEDNIGMVCGRTLPLNKNNYNLSTKTSNIAEIFKYPSSPWDMGNGNNIAIKKNTIGRVGLFDVRFGPGAPLKGSEDIDYLYRVIRSGFSVLYSPDPLVFHNHSSSNDVQYRSVKFSYAIARGAFYSKYILARDIYVLKLLYWEVLNYISVISCHNFNTIFTELRGLLIGAGLMLKYKGQI